MSNFYFSNGNQFFFIDFVRVLFSDYNGIKNYIYTLIRKFSRKKGKYVASKLGLL
jgi:hypothetical protein